MGGETSVRVQDIWGIREPTAKNEGDLILSQVRQGIESVGLMNAGGIMMDA